MIYEKIDKKIDIDLLRNSINENTRGYDPFMVSKSFGGWSVTSFTGDYRDGWQKGDLVYTDAYKNAVDKEEFIRNLGIRKNTEHINKTQVCKGYLNTVTDELISAGFEPCRMRLSLLKSKGESIWHRDAEDDQYAVRLHIPIFTNEECFFETEEGKAHLVADGSIYIVRVNRMHRVTNHGNQDRLHLIMNISHKVHFTKQLQFA